MDLTEFINNYVGLSKYRGLTQENPVKFSLESETGSTFILIVSYSEPTFAKTPYNVLWINPDTNVLLRRTSHDPAMGFSGTWEEVVSYDDVFSYAQYWMPVVENPQDVGIDPVEVYVPRATTSDQGIIKLSANPSGAVAVEDSDDRMTNTRDPLDHDHADYPRSLIRISADTHAIVNESTSPAANAMLFLVSDNGDGTFGAEWRPPTETDVAWTQEQLEALTVRFGPNVTTVSDGASYFMQAEAQWTNRTESNPDDVSWSISDNDKSIVISGDGELVIPDLDSSYSFTVYANKMDPVTSDDIQGSIVVNVEDLFTPELDVTSIVIEGPVTMWEYENSSYVVRAYFSDGSSQLVIPDTFTLTGDAGTLSGQDLQGTDVDTDTVVELGASFTSNEVTVNTTLDVTIRDVTFALAINGVTSMDEGETETFTVTATYNDGRSEDIAYSAVDSFVSDNAALVLSEYDGTAQDVNEDTVVTLTAEFTDIGKTESATHLVTIQNVARQIVSIEILGADALLEGDTESYTVEATFDDGFKTTVTPDSFTLDATTHAALSGMDLTGSDVASDQTVTLNASYTYLGTEVTTTKDVTIQNVVLTSIELTGAPASVDERMQTVLSVTAHYDNGATRVLAFADLDSLVHDDVSGYIAGHTGYDVTVASVEGNQTVTFTAQYTEEGITVSDDFALTIVDAGLDIASIAIVGDTSFYETDGRDYSLIATMSDGSTMPISGTDASVTWSLVGSAGTLTDNRVDGTEVLADTVVTLNVTYAEDTVDHIATLDVTILNVVPASLSLTGPSTMEENSTATLVAEVTYSDGATALVTVDSLVADNMVPISSISGMDVTSDEVGTDIGVTFTGEYTEESVTVSDTHVITITDETVYLDTLGINGPNTMDENDTEAYTVTAYFTDGSNSVVSVGDLDVWTATAPGVLSGNDLTVGDVTTDTTVTLDATYTLGGITRSATKDVTVENNVVTSIAIVGPSSVQENSTQDFTFNVVYSDGSNVQVTAAELDLFETDSPAVSSISGATLTTGEVTSDTGIVLSAQYTKDGVTVSDTHNVTVTDKAVIQTLNIFGAASIMEGESEDYTFNVVYTDGTPKPLNVSDLNFFTSDNAAGSVSSNTVTAGAVNSDTVITLTAEYTEDGVTLTDTHSVTIEDNYVDILQIMGSTTIDEGTSETYTFQVTYKDGSTKFVTAALLDSFTSNNGIVTISGDDATAGSVTLNTAVILSAEYTENGVTISDVHSISVINTSKAVTGIDSINGPDSINETNSGNYTITVRYDDGTTDIQNADTWSLTSGSSHGSINSSGVLSTNEVTQDEDVIVRADYQGFNATKDVTVVDVPVVATALTITGDASADELTTVSLTATADLSDSSSLDVTASATWSFVGDEQGSSFTSPGEVLLGDVSSNTTITVRATYTHPTGGTVSDDHEITIRNVAAATRLYKYGVVPMVSSHTMITASWVKSNITNDIPLVGGDTVDGSVIGPMTDDYFSTIQAMVIPADEGRFNTYISDRSDFSSGYTHLWWGDQSWTDYLDLGDPARVPIVVDIDGVDHYVYIADFSAGGPWYHRIETARTGNYPGWEEEEST